MIENTESGKMTTKTQRPFYMDIGWGQDKRETNTLSREAGGSPLLGIPRVFPDQRLCSQI